VILEAARQGAGSLQINGTTAAGSFFLIASASEVGSDNDVKRRDFNRIVLEIGLCPMLANSAGAQATGQTETFAQAPTKNGVAEMSTNDPMAAVRGRKALLDNGMRCGQMVFQGDEAAALVDERTFLIDQMP